MRTHLKFVTHLPDRTASYIRNRNHSPLSEPQISERADRETACLSVYPSVRPSVSLYVCPPVCVSVHLSTCLSVRPSACLSACLSVSLSVRPSACLPVCLSACLSVSLSVRPSLCLPVCLSVRLSVRLSVCPSVCLSVRLSVCLSVCLQDLRTNVFFYRLMTPSVTQNIERRMLRFVISNVKRIRKGIIVA